MNHLITVYFFDFSGTRGLSFDFYQHDITAIGYTTLTSLFAVANYGAGSSTVSSNTNIVVTSNNYFLIRCSPTNHGNSTIADWTGGNLGVKGVKITYAL